MLEGTLNRIYDVIIVGAGPAGATAAFFLGDAGLDVLVLEKERLPRYKPCGGGISASVLDQFPFSFDSVIERRPTSITYALQDRTVTVPVRGDQILMVMRDRFDALLLSHARAQVWTGKPVTSVDEGANFVEIKTADGARIRGRHLIGADGANSIVARSLGLRPQRVLAAALEIELPAPDETIRRFADSPLFIFGEVEMGYLWIFPKESHLSVGIGALRPRRNNLKDNLKRVMANYGLSLEDASVHGHPLPIYWKRQPISSRRAFLVGDAAGLVDPFTGEGIRLAIKSGRLAAEAIISGALERYPELVDREIGRSQRLGLRLSQIFYRYPEAAWQLAVRNPFASKAFIDLISDRTSYRGVLATFLVSLPYYAPARILPVLLSRLGQPSAAAALEGVVFRSNAPIATR